MRKNYMQLFDLFYGDYDERYCKQNKLFIDYDSKGNIKHITKSLVDYAYEIIMTDLSLIFGNRFEVVVSDNDNATEKLQEIMESNDFDKFSRLFVVQGLILGDTAAKIGRDKQGNIRFGLVSFLNGKVSYKVEYGQIVEWRYEYDMKHEEGSIHVVEVYRKDRVQILYDDKVFLDVPNRYGRFWFIHVANSPSLEDDVFGESELERIGDTIDEMNSTLSRISAIEDIYAKPRIIASGVRGIENLKQHHNIWAIPESADLKILEFQGNVIDSMLKKYQMLENYLRNKCPELILNDLGNISGYALKLKLSKLIKKIENYRKVYFEGFKKLFELALAMEGYPNANVQIHVDPVIPADEVEDINKWAQLLGMNIVSRQTVAEALGIDFKQEQERIDEENSWILGLMQHDESK